MQLIVVQVQYRKREGERDRERKVSKFLQEKQKDTVA